MYAQQKGDRVNSVVSTHCKKEMVILTLLRLSQLQLNDTISLPTLCSSILLRLKAVGKVWGVQSNYVSNLVL